ncbi:hypothetical protein C8N32_10269 [Rhodovulum imhoffii]|uniref:DUF484 family protein n=1 Tax=Rhodovulum imhoffii TaxID=365340 RepID=A0A2T5BVE9_9RHOB|nr:DUF484 family protein [Rhodovulum imhoffii]MBK5934205.1 recombinase XerC [Rhodovulum imhoffii]PTN03548.1 hypothetical protein C8N32_10269 [Rhodovulum imhoffii]
MSRTPNSDLRAQIIANPETILSDPDVMRALVGANERMMGDNIVDLRSIAMEKLENRLGQLEQTHQQVIAAAYENLAGTKQVHRAVLRLLDPTDFESFLLTLGSDVKDALRIKALRLVLETGSVEQAHALRQFQNLLLVESPGFIDSLSNNRRQVNLRICHPHGDPHLYGGEAPSIRSEALLRLDLGTGRLPGLLVMAAEAPETFAPNQGSDLLAFFAGVFERTMRRWLG